VIQGQQDRQVHKDLKVEEDQQDRKDLRALQDHKGEREE
jgi:hypothetical protein